MAQPVMTCTGCSVLRASVPASSTDEPVHIITQPLDACRWFQLACPLLFCVRQGTSLSIRNFLYALAASTGPCPYSDSVVAL